VAAIEELFLKAARERARDVLSEKKKGGLEKLVFPWWREMTLNQPRRDPTSPQKLKQSRSGSKSDIGKGQSLRLFALRLFAKLAYHLAAVTFM
jgi:hypothetical protein